jgi:hypothetical protein
LLYFIWAFDSGNGDVNDMLFCLMKESIEYMEFLDFALLFFGCQKMIYIGMNMHNINFYHLKKCQNQGKQRTDKAIKMIHHFNICLPNKKTILWFSLNQFSS